MQFKNQVNYLPETNIDPEKQWLEDEMSSGDGLFSGAKKHFLESQGATELVKSSKPWNPRRWSPPKKKHGFVLAHKKKGERIAETFKGKK